MNAHREPQAPSPIGRPPWRNRHEHPWSNAPKKEKPQWQ
jgi:hypothetical protein